MVKPWAEDMWERLEGRVGGEDCWEQKRHLEGVNSGGVDWSGSTSESLSAEDSCCWSDSGSTLGLRGLECDGLFFCCLGAFAEGGDGVVPGSATLS